MNLHPLKGVIYVILGAASYGILATIVKYANSLGMHTGVLTFLQYGLGFLILIMLQFIFIRQQCVSLPSKLKLVSWGTTLGITSTMYYLSLRYIPVSMGIILLMQSIWLGLVLEWIMSKKFQGWKKIMGAILCILGTMMATNLLNDHLSIDIRGVALGFLAAISYTISIFATSTIEKKLPNIVRSKYLVLGGAAFILLFWNVQIFHHFSTETLPWGFVLGTFGTVIPPLFFTAGIPLTGIGLGSILSSVEIPVSLISAQWILGEKFIFSQWLGVLLIVFSIILVNIQITKK